MLAAAFGGLFVRAGYGALAEEWTRAAAAGVFAVAAKHRARTSTRPQRQQTSDHLPTARTARRREPPQAAKGGRGGTAAPWYHPALRAMASRTPNYDRDPAARPLQPRQIDAVEGRRGRACGRSNAGGHVARARPCRGVLCAPLACPIEPSADAGRVPPALLLFSGPPSLIAAAQANAADHRRRRAPPRDPAAGGEPRPRSVAATARPPPDRHKEHSSPGSEFFAPGTVVGTRELPQAAPIAVFCDPPPPISLPRGRRHRRSTGREARTTLRPHRPPRASRSPPHPERSAERATLTSLPPTGQLSTVE